MLDLLFPIQCLNCGINGEYICPYCFKKLKNTLPECYMCRRISNRYKTHEQCNIYNLSSCFVAWEYNSVAKKILKQYKYKFAFKLAETISDVLIRRMESTGFSKTIKKESIIIPMPIHPLHERERGFNQSFFIAKTLAEQFNCSFEKDLVRRIGDSGYQSKRKLEERKMLKSKFILNSNIRGEDIIIIDDVVSTGTTLNNACSVFKNNFIKAICLFRGRPQYSILQTPNPHQEQLLD